MSRIWAIGATSIRRLLRDRSNIFFVFILPLAIILLVGAQFGSSGGSTRIAVSSDDGRIATEIIDGLEAEENVTVDRFSGEADVVDVVERAIASAGVVIPEGVDGEIEAGATPTVGVVTRPDDTGALGPLISGVIAEATATERVARVLAAETDQPFEAWAPAVEGTNPAGIDVVEETVGESLFPPGTGQFTVGAAQQLVLFVFLTTLTGSAALIQSRRLGVSRRMLSTPTPVGSIVVGEGTGRFAVGVFQGVYIILITFLAFGVEWGDLLGGMALLVLLAATAAGAAMLIGTVMENDQQAAGFSIFAGLGLAALGGCMLPLELFSPTMNRIAHVTPHAWAIDGYSTLVYEGGSFGDVLVELGVLAIYAAVLLSIAGWRLRRTLTAPA